MKMRRGLRWAALACWGLALVPAIPHTVGAAESSTARLDAQGWWNRSQALPVQGNPTGLDDPTGLGLTTAPTVPAPATVPEDGLYVANDATGASAVAAVRYVLDGQAGGTFTLHLADGSALTGTEEVVACPVLGGFTPAQNGRWDAKPGYDETACVIEGTATEAGDGLTFDVPSSFASMLGDISIIVVPAPGSTTPFTLGFDKPSDGDFVVTTPVVPPTTTPAPRPSEVGVPVYRPEPAPSFSTPSSPTVSSPTIADGGSDDQVAAPATSTPVVAASKPSRASQVWAVVLLVALGAGFWLLAARPQRVPRLLGSVGGKQVELPAATVAVSKLARPRGIGRFARARTAPASRL
jgi:hypothetical protein